MWFAASLLFKSVHAPVQRAEPLWEERLILVQALTRDEANAKATSIGEQGVHSYKTVVGDIVTWMFDCVLCVYEIEGAELSDGTELFSRFLKDTEVGSLKAPFDD
jgi:hypothetical protein